MADQRGLKGLLDVLERNDVEFFVDSGVALALHRDGEMLAWEKDIDLAVESSQIDALLSCTLAFQELGYSVVAHRYHGRLYALALTPSARRSDRDLRAAVHVFYRVRDQLVSPQTQIYVPPPAPDVIDGPRSPIGRILQRGIDRWFYQSPVPAGQPRSSRAPDNPSLTYRLGRWVYRRLDRGLMAETWPISEVYVPLTWVVPYELVFPLGTLGIDGREVPVPGRLDDYLTYRYGQWRTPVSDWCYWEDDGAIRRSRPADILRELHRTT